jgi:hypothetical protein
MFSVNKKFFNGSGNNVLLTETRMDGFACHHSVPQVVSKDSDLGMIITVKQVVMYNFLLAWRILWVLKINKK